MVLTSKTTITMKDLKIEIGKRVLQARKELGLTQVEIENRAQISQGYISHVEKGNQNPSFDFLVKLASTYDLSIDCLVPLKCGSGDFIVYLIELKATHRMDKENIRAKFKTTIENFMSKRFKNIFLNERHSIRRLHLCLVGGSKKQWRKEGALIDVLRTEKPFKFNGKRYQIERHPDLTIKKC